MKSNILSNLVAVVAITAVYGTAAQAGFITDKFDEVTPSACKDVCRPWSSSIGTCVEKLGQRIGVSIDPVTGAFDIIGDKFGMYLCVCSTGTTNASAECLACVSKVLCIESAPLAVEDYSNVCYGKVSPFDLIKTKKLNATC